MNTQMQLVVDLTKIERSAKQSGWNFNELLPLLIAQYKRVHSWSEMVFFVGADGPLVEIDPCRFVTLSPISDWGSLREAVNDVLEDSQGLDAGIPVVFLSGASLWLDAAGVEFCLGAISSGASGGVLEKQPGYRILFLDSPKRMAELLDTVVDPYSYVRVTLSKKVTGWVVDKALFNNVFAYLSLDCAEGRRAFE